VYQQGGTAVHIALDRFDDRGVKFIPNPFNATVWPHSKGGNQMYQDNANREDATKTMESTTTDHALTEAQYLYEMATALNFFGAGRMEDFF
jgi:hypothetical protein